MTGILEGVTCQARADCIASRDMSAAYRPVLAMVVVGVAIACSACHTTTRLALPSSTPPEAQVKTAAALKRNDTVKMQMTDGRRRTIVIAVVEPDALVAIDGKRYPFSDIASLEQVKLAKGRTAALAVAIGVGGFFLLAWIAFLNWGVGGWSFR